MNKSSLRGAIGGGGKENQQTLPPPKARKETATSLRIKWPVIMINQATIPLIFRNLFTISFCTAFAVPFMGQAAVG
jgi:hypothetical protein